MTAYNTALDKNPARLNIVVNRRRNRNNDKISTTMVDIHLIALCALVIGSYLTI